MTAYMTKTGFTETKVNELYLAALQRAAMYNTGATELDFLRKQAVTCAISINRNFSVSAPFAGLLNINRNPHFSSHCAVFLPLHWFVNSGQSTAFILDADDEPTTETVDPNIQHAEALTGACVYECGCAPACVCNLAHTRPQVP